LLQHLFFFRSDLKPISAPKWVSILLLSALSLSCSGCQEPPLALFEQAHSALQMAARAGAVRYAEAQYREAETLLQEARLEAARQKGRFLLFRDFKAADSLLSLAFEAANRAAIETRNRIRELQSQAENENELLQTQLANWRQALNGSLEIYMAAPYLSSADLALKKSEYLIIEGEYIAAVESVAEGTEALIKLSQMLAAYADDEAEKIRVWRRWVRETVDESRLRGAAIIVDKSAHKLYLVQRGKLTQTYDCELGYNAAGQKFFAGDGATPEGKYHITKTKDESSKYYRALLINYPNELDKKRFAESKVRGIISPQARIGALIEIHGEGGKKKDWTDGCVALTNTDLDHLMQYVAVGTPVTIVRRTDEWP
jgi:L,D-peptidoglycan transpeptidase YkuD (ErfK/YbiS/YcfS/YnhG family)